MGTRECRHGSSPPTDKKPFEAELAEYLQAHGWLYSENSTGYDRARAVFPEDVLGWLGETKPVEFAKAALISAAVTGKIDVRGL